MSTNNNNNTVAKALLAAAGVVVSGFATYQLFAHLRKRGGCGGCCPFSSKSAPASAPASDAAAAVPTQKKPRVVFVLGGPGAGKGTQCAHIVSDFGFVHLSAGDLLRDEQKKGGETGNMIKQLIADGKIVPVAVTLGLLKAAMSEHMSAGRHLFLIDGFPRNYDNLEGWNNAMEGFAEVEFCLFLDCPEEVMEARLLKRGESSGRIDDNAEAIKKRFLTYVESTKPVIDSFAAANKVRQVSAAPPVEEVRQEIKRIFEQIQWN